MDWFEFGIAGALFLLTHHLPTVPSVRRRLVHIMGRLAFALTYSTLSLVMLAWLIVAAGRAPYAPLWSTEPWQPWVPLLGMPVACALLVFSIGVPNPLSFGGGNERLFDPERPGFVGFVRHGLLWALVIWSASHIPPNGDLAHVILFGSFAAFAFLGMIIIDRRKQRQCGMPEWQRLAQKTSFWPGQSLILRRWEPTAAELRHAYLQRGFLAVSVFVVLLGTHVWVIGVSPLPW
ncbi:MAG: NnrU family protein [Pseudomonadota bacterium]